MKAVLLSLMLPIILAACARQDDHRPQIRRSALQGIWWSPQMFQSAAFQIKDSTIYYPDDFKEFKYELNGDTLLVYQDDGFVLRSVILKASADTLILVTQDVKEIYTRSETPIP